MHFLHVFPKKSAHDGFKASYARMSPAKADTSQSTFVAFLPRERAERRKRLGKTDSEVNEESVGGCGAYVAFLPCEQAERRISSDSKLPDKKNVSHGTTAEYVLLYFSRAVFDFLSYTPPSLSILPCS